MALAGAHLWRTAALPAYVNLFSEDNKPENVCFDFSGITHMKAVRADIAELDQNGITKLALPRIGDPGVIPLWFGVSDRVTPAFIRDAAGVR